MTESSANSYARIPSVHQLMESRKLARFADLYSRDFILFVVQNSVALLRTQLHRKTMQKASREQLAEIIIDRCANLLAEARQPALQRVINGTGIILHTGLGRAPLSEAAVSRLTAVAEGYSALEFDLQTGKRGSRHDIVEMLLCFLTGAEAACVVNNNAAAVFIALNTLSSGREAIISRGQLVEIGGSFRIPEVMEKSNAIMHEVGTTNRTHVADYRNAINQNSGLICVVHPSNYRVKGFTADVDLAELVQLSKQHKIPVLQDLGGGILIDLQQYGLPYEPVVRESIRSGVDVVTFSGDKVLGGPQCGILAGGSDYIAAIKSNPLMRVLRCDKLIYAALEATLRLYLNETKLHENHMVFKLMLKPVKEIQKRAQAILKKAGAPESPEVDVRIVETRVQIGSGTMPLEHIPSIAISIACPGSKAEELAREFRSFDPPVIGYIREEKLFFDLRTIFPEDDAQFVSAIRKILTI